MKPVVLPADIQALIAFCRANVVGATIPLASVNSMGQVIQPGPTPQLPPYPARPTDPVLAAFYDDMVVPLYNAAYAMGQAWAAQVAASAPPPIPETPGQPAGYIPSSTPDGGGF